MKAIYRTGLLLLALISGLAARGQILQYRGAIQEVVAHSPLKSYYKDIVLGDVDNDGDIDIYVLQKQTNGDTVVAQTTDLVYLNNGAGITGTASAAFTLIPTSSAFTNPSQILTAKGYDGELVDMDGDGNLDIVRIDRGDANIAPTSRFGTVHVMWGNGSGQFTSQLVNEKDPNMKDTQNCNAHNLSSQLNYDNVEVSDLDGDGDLDFIVSQLNSCGCNLMVKNLGGRQFQIINSGGKSGACQLDADFTHTVAIGDYNDDGLPDVILGKNSSQVEIYRGTGAFQFASTPTSLFIPGGAFQTTISEFADVNQDGFPDIVAGKDDKQSVYLHDGTSNNNPYTLGRIDVTIGPAKYMYDTRVADVNNNLQMEIVSIDHGARAGDGFNSHLITVHNILNGQFSDKKSQFVGNVDNGIVAVSLADLDNDGDLDMVTGGVGNGATDNSRSAIHIYENTSNPVNLIMSNLPNVTSVVIHKNRVVVQKASNAIEVDAYKVEEDATVTFMAGTEITLKEGFEANFDSEFTAFIGTTLGNPPNTHGRSADLEEVTEVSEASNELIEPNPFLYPNPFENVAHLRYTLENEGMVSVILYNTSGAEVVRLMDNKEQVKGEYELEIDARILPEGLYYYVLKTGTRTFSGQILKKR